MRVVAFLALAAAVSARLVQFDFEEPMDLSEHQIQQRIANSTSKWVNYIDLSGEDAFMFAEMTEANSPIPSVLRQQSTIRPLLSMLSSANLVATTTHMQNYHTRHRLQPTGVEAAVWLANQFRLHANNRNDVTVELFTHSGYPQQSVIARVQGTSDSNEVVVIGAHLDSIAGAATARAPGADDDAVGCACVLEAFRVIMASGFRPQRTVVFFGFAAEEGGLLGSGDIVARYFNRGASPIMSMLQVEMNGYQWAQRGLAVSIVQDQFTHTPLNNLVAMMVREYTSAPSFTGPCGSCSDHVQFTRAGYRSACIAEDVPGGRGLNPGIHTTRDTIEAITWSQVYEFAKVSLAYVIELGNAPF